MQFLLNGPTASLPKSTPPAIRLAARSLDEIDRRLGLAHKILNAATSIEDVTLATHILKVSASMMEAAKKGIKQIGWKIPGKFNLIRRLDVQEELFKDLSFKSVSVPAEFIPPVTGPGEWSFRSSAVKLPTLQTHMVHFSRSRPIIESVAKSILQARRKVDAARWMLKSLPTPEITRVANGLLTEADQHLVESADDMGLLVSRGFMPPETAIRIWRQTKKLLGLSRLKSMAISAGPVKTF